MLTKELLPKSRKLAGKKKLFLPIFLILLLVSAFIWQQTQKTKFTFNFSFGPRPLVEPIASPTKDEELKSKLIKAGLQVKSLNFQKDQIVASLSGDLVVIFSQDKDLESQVASLQFVLSRTKIEGKNPTKIDLRFEKPVLEFK